MELANGFLSAQIEDDSEDWREVLIRKREIRSAILFEIEALTKANIAPEIIDALKETGRQISAEILAILQAASESE